MKAHIKKVITEEVGAPTEKASTPTVKNKPLGSFDSAKKKSPMPVSPAQKTVRRTQSRGK